MLLRFFIAFGGLTETGKKKKNAAECQDVMRGSKCRDINMIFFFKGYNRPEGAHGKSEYAFRTKNHLKLVENLVNCNDFNVHKGNY